MSIGDATRLSREMGKELFPGSNEFRFRTAKSLVQDGFLSSEDLEGADLKHSVWFKQLNTEQLAWFENWLERIQNTARHKRSVPALQARPCFEPPKDRKSARAVIELLNKTAANPPRSVQGTPTCELERLSQECSDEMERGLWKEVSILEATCGSLRPKTIAGSMSAIRLWTKFANTMLDIPVGQELPPPSFGIAAWSRIFRCARTFKGYVGKLKIACMIAQVPLDVFRKDLTDRCALMIEKSQGPPRERMFIRRHLLVRLVNLAKQERDESSALLYVLSYAFMLRVPSEALPMRMATVEDAACGPSGETQQFMQRLVNCIWRCTAARISSMGQGWFVTAGVSRAASRAPLTRSNGQQGVSARASHCSPTSLQRM